MPPRTQVLIDPRELPHVRAVRLEVRKGPEKGVAVDVSAEPIRIGTAEGCELRLSDPAVSGMHAVLSRTPLGLVLRDLGSTNGIFVDGRRVVSVYITEPTRVGLGASEVRVVPLERESPVELSGDDRFGELLGASPAMRALFAKLSRIAAADVTVLLTGETGTGKELAAAALRDNSGRRAGPFVVVDCGALPATLIESELFGHERGAFTGADRSRPGAFERASGGTLFLDEVGELPLALQPSLLGVLERRELRRVGGSEVIPVEVRVIAATNRDLAAEVARGAFRADLYYRLAVVELHLPPLREHASDVPLLVEHFLDNLPGERPVIGEETLAQMMAYPWPGNVRELQNVVERAALLAEAPSLGPGSRRPAPHAGAAAPQPAAPPEAVSLDVPFKEQKAALIARFEREYLRRLLAACDGNVAAAARKAGIDRMWVYKLMERYRDEG
jgi:transcriptional regulator with GAF, ATPase, and Fis domain